MEFGVDSIWGRKGGWLRRGEVNCISITPSKLAGDVKRRVIGAQRIPWILLRYEKWRRREEAPGSSLHLSRHGPFQSPWGYLTARFGPWTGRALRLSLLKLAFTPKKARSEARIMWRRDQASPHPQVAKGRLRQVVAVDATSLTIERAGLTRARIKRAEKKKNRRQDYYVSPNANSENPKKEGGSTHSRACSVSIPDAVIAHFFERCCNFFYIKTLGISHGTISLVFPRDPTCISPASVCTNLRLFPPSFFFTKRLDRPIVSQGGF